MPFIFIIIVAAGFLFFPSAPEAAASSRTRIPAKAAVIMDSSGAVLYAKYPDAKLAPASTVKLVAAMVAIDKLLPEQKVTISRNASKTRTILLKLHPGEELTVSDLLHLALIQSVNSAAVALAEAAAGSEADFTVLMNQKAKALGARNTHFTNASGLPKGIQYTTASDLALIMRAALAYPQIMDILAKRMWLVRTAGGRELVLQTSNELLWQNSGVMGGKTGYTGDARHCFVCAIQTEKGPLFLSVLGARSRSSLWKSALLLAELGMNPDLVGLTEKTRLAKRVSHPVIQQGLRQ